MWPLAQHRARAPRRAARAVTAAGASGAAVSVAVVLSTGSGGDLVMWLTRRGTTKGEKKQVECP